jgi:hypothetical protein
MNFGRDVELFNRADCPTSGTRSRPVSVAAVAVSGSHRCVTVTFVDTWRHGHKEIQERNIGDLRSGYISAFGELLRAGPALVK